MFDMISEWIGSDRAGSIIEGRFPLQRWLGGADESGVFLTEIGGVSPRKAAIKIIPAGIADAEALLNQWTQAKRRIHPHLIPVHHAGYCRMDDCDLLYVVTDRADEVLADVLPVRALTPTEVREMLDPVLETLTWLHGQGLVHGGLKPSNVMVVDEQIRLSADRVQPAGARIFPVLTPGIYEAPECTIKVTPAADLWSLGVLLIETLTQKPPSWSGTGPRIAAPLPQPFAAIASECLRLDPSRRCSVREIRSHLTPTSRTVTMPAPASNARHVPAAEASRVAPVESAPAAPAAGSSPAPPASPSPEPFRPMVVPPDFAERVAALLEPALRIPNPAKQEEAKQDEAERGEAIAEVKADPETKAAAEATADSKSPVAAAPVKDAPVAVPATADTAKTETAAPAAAPRAAVPAELPVKTAPPMRAPQAPDWGAGERALAAAQRRSSLPAAEPAETAQKARGNRLATLIASTMVVIAAGLMFVIALHVSHRSSSATSAPPAPGEPAANSQAPAALVSAGPPSALASTKPVLQTAASGATAATTARGGVVHSELPHVTQHALDTIDGKLVVIVRVQVDANGNVTDASYEYEGSSHYLKTAALAAAQNWKFRPALAGAQPVPSTWDLQFWFGHDGPTVVPIEKTP